MRSPPSSGTPRLTRDPSEPRHLAARRGPVPRLRTSGRCAARRGRGAPQRDLDRADWCARDTSPVWSAVPDRVRRARRRSDLVLDRVSDQRPETARALPLDDREDLGSQGRSSLSARRIRSTTASRWTGARPRSSRSVRSARRSSWSVVRSTATRVYPCRIQPPPTSRRASGLLGDHASVVDVNDEEAARPWPRRELSATLASDCGRVLAVANSRCDVSRGGQIVGQTRCDGDSASQP